MDPLTPDPFNALNLPHRFDLSPSEIERAYLARAAAAHPDLNTADDEEPADTSANINLARQTLLNPQTRANALLDHLKGPSAAELKALPQDFLTSIMQTRLEIEEAIETGDPKQIKYWRTWAAAERARYTELVQIGFDTEPFNDHVKAAIRTNLNAWRYIERLIEQLPEA